MLELIAQGKTAHDRWRKVLLRNLPFVLGRTANDWAVGWDEKVSRKHARLRLVENVLCVERIPEAANPIFYNGCDEDSFSMNEGEHFVIGDTTFLLTNDSAMATMELPSPIAQRGFSADFLRQVRYQDADRRIAVLNRLPEIISKANNSEELHGQMVNMLLAGIRSSTVVGICRREDDGKIEVVAWDKRELSGGDFGPSAPLIEQALEKNESTLHMWGATEADSNMTIDLINDWAFVCPLSGPANKGWAIYVSGLKRNKGPEASDSEQEENDVQGDVKFAELVGATLANLRRVQQLEERQSTFRAFFSPVVMEAFVDRDPEEVLQPRQCEISVLFCDLRGFSAKSEQMSDQLEELLDRVSQALGIMTKTVLDFGGVIGDFHGDSAMGFWGWPLDKSDAADNVCSAAMQIRKELAEIAAQPSHRLHDFQMGIGVATGNAVAGKIGTSHQVKVTAFGPVVNLAARYEGMTRKLNIPILVDRNTVEQVSRNNQSGEKLVDFRLVGRFRPFGLNVASDVYQMGAPAELPSQAVRDSYEQALGEFTDGKWDSANELLQAICEDDPAARFLSLHIADSEKPDGFDGVIDLGSK